jgi:hypothetical protein
MARRRTPCEAQDSTTQHEKCSLGVVRQYLQAAGSLLQVPTPPYQCR